MIPKIAATSVYLDKGEGLEYITGQVERMRAQGVQEYYFDVICTPEQIKQALDILAKFYELVADMLPLTKVFTGITCDDQIRPAMITIATMAGSNGGKTKTVDVNPERPNR